MKKYYRKKRKNSVLFFLMLVLTAVILIYFIFAVRLLPILKTMAVNNAKIIALQTVNNAVGKVLKDNDVTYDKLMNFRTDSTGKITAVEADTLQINLLKYEITKETIKEINDIDKASLGIPLGTIIGGDLLSGTGPCINVEIAPIGNVETNITNQFSAAGINQTRQEINLNVKTSITVIISSCNVSTDIESNFTLADTVIVGGVPDYYTVVEDGSSSGLSNSEKAFIYGKNQSSVSK